MESSAQSRQADIRKKQDLLNNIVNEIFELSASQQQRDLSAKNSKGETTNPDHKSDLSEKKRTRTFGSHSVAATPSTKTNLKVNFHELFDLLIWAEKRKQNQLVSSIVEMGVFEIVIKESFQKGSTHHYTESKLHPKQYDIEEIKAFILLVNNMKVSGTIATYLLREALVDKVLIKYLNSIKIQSGRQDCHDSFEEKLEYLGSFLKAYHSHLNKDTYKYFLRQVLIHSNTSQSDVVKSEKKNTNFFDDLFSMVGSSQLVTKNPSPQTKTQCLLVSLCCSLFNCPEDLTKTLVLNLLMSIFKEPFAKQMLYTCTANSTLQLHPHVRKWSQNLCCQLRNDLKNFNQQLKVLQSSEQEAFFQEFNDHIILWEDLTTSDSEAEKDIKEEIFRDNFLHMVIYPLIVSSLNTNSLPMFDIKFAFFTIAKMMPIIVKLNLLKRLGEIFFKKNTKINYKQSWLSTALLEGFNLESTLRKLRFVELEEKFSENESKKQEQSDETEDGKGHFVGTSDFFENMLRSKDEQFLLISTHLLQQIIQSMKAQPPETVQYFIKDLGFGKNSQTVCTLTQILVKQLNYDHSLEILRKICEMMIYIQPTNFLSDENSNEFIYFYKGILQETLDFIEKGQQFHDYLVETFEYDMKLLESMSLKIRKQKDSELLISKIEEVSQPLVVKEQKHSKSNKKQKLGQESQSNNVPTFYSLIPETPSQILRYRVVKIFLFLKFSEAVLEAKQKSWTKEGEQQSTLTKYVWRLRQWEEKQLKPGQSLEYPIKHEYHHCKMMEEKVEIPCVVIEDDTCLVIGHVDNKSIRVMINLKFKLIRFELFHPKKDRPCIRIQSNKFDFKLQNLVPNTKHQIHLKDFSSGIEYLKIKAAKFKHKELNSIKKGLNKILTELPTLSLI